MKKSISAATFILMILIGWVGSFWLTRVRAIANWQQDNPIWLADVSDDIIESEDTFCQWVQKHKQTLKDQQLELGRLLEDPTSDDQSILTQVKQIGLTHEGLLHGIAKHVKSMRSALPENQKELLRGFCLQTLKGPMHRNGQGQQVQDDLTQHARPGRHGFGNGYRHGRRQGQCGLTRKLQLTNDQLLVAQQKDPDFEQDIRQLQTQLLAERQSLISLLENQQALNGQITEQVDHIITANNALERRLIDYILVMRPYFTADQQKKLIGLCENNCSDCCNTSQSP